MEREPERWKTASRVCSPFSPDVHVSAQPRSSSRSSPCLTLPVPRIVADGINAPAASARQDLPARAVSPRCWAAAGIANAVISPSASTRPKPVASLPTADVTESGHAVTAWANSVTTLPHAMAVSRKPQGVAATVGAVVGGLRWACSPWEPASNSRRVAAREIERVVSESAATFSRAIRAWCKYRGATRARGTVIVPPAS